MQGAHISYPASAAAVVFGVYLSTRAVYRFDRKSPAIPPCVYLRDVSGHAMATQTH